MRNNITGRDGAEIDHIELFGPSKTADSQNFVLCPGKAYDRSPCGTGTSAKLACLYADGKLREGEIWRQESIVGTVFEGSIHRHGSVLDFRVSDREDSKVSIPVRYSGEVPDPFADGREVIVSGKVDNGTFLAQRDSLITKCPSKFATQAKQDPQHVIISQ